MEFSKIFHSDTKVSQRGNPFSDGLTFADFFKKVKE